MEKRERREGALWGAIVGDALGVPVEFQDRTRLEDHPVTDMRGFGTHSQPPGTWSDDSSLLLCTVEGLQQKSPLDRTAALFIRWMRDNYWTPWGRVFDIGGTVRTAILRLAEGVAPRSAGGSDENSNGNGSLMRILPVALAHADAPTPHLLGVTHEFSALTHRHPRSLIACGIYSLIVRELLKGTQPATACRKALEEAAHFYTTSSFQGELSHFNRLLSGKIDQVPEGKIRTSGYVVHTLEASVWCLLKSSNFEETVLKAVNLGDDADTTGCVAGGLAGAAYGMSAIPPPWLSILAKRDDLEKLFETFLGNR